MQWFFYNCLILHYIHFECLKFTLKLYFSTKLVYEGVLTNNGYIGTLYFSVSSNLQCIADYLGMVDDLQKKIQNDGY